MGRTDAGVVVAADRTDPDPGGGLLAMLVGMAGISAALLAWQLVTPEPLHGFGVRIDRLSAALTLLVAWVGSVTFHFSRRYLDGDPDRPRFLRYLAFTIGSAYVLMLATNLVLLFVAWSLTSLGLHRLLTYYPGRPEALRPARKKFLISRLGDVALVAAIALIWREYATLDLHEFLAALAPIPTEGVTAIGLLVVIAALTKSAQFPFHSWLPETMESPTPVSAIMHAGVINAGGALVLRFAPLIVRVPEALLLLAVIGTITASLGLLAMWAQVKFKRTLAWSTVSQMGFMMVQCGVGAFPAALLHIIGHGCYKAWSFLRSGTLPAPSRPYPPVAPVRRLAIAGMGTVFAVPALALASIMTGYSPLHSPGELALTAVIALSVGQVWVAVRGNRATSVVEAAIQTALGIGATLAVPVAAFAAYRGAEEFLAPVIGTLPTPAGPLAWAAAVVPVMAFTGLTLVHALLPVFGRSASGRSFYVHALHGFYFGAVADRVVDGLWGGAGNPTLEVKHA
ncbi:MAG: oxidoreductase [Planctomycetaceae bacterium]|nr:oxidoreductase [Planctomycetaceae bacterium]